MKQSLLLFSLSILLASCNPKDAEGNKKKIDECDVTYIALVKEDKKYCDYLAEDIKEQAATGNSNIRKYDSLTVVYLNYMDSISDAIRKNSSAIFFDGDNYSRTGKEFIKRTGEYKTAVEALAGENLKKRLNLVLNTNDTKMTDGEISDNNEFNTRETNVVYFKYLDYYYRGFPIDQNLAFVSSKKRSILEMEKEYILFNQNNH